MQPDLRDDETKRPASSDSPPVPSPRKPPTPAAQRALDEAAARRAARDAEKPNPSKELQGRGGLDPVRYGDWETDGRASDF